MRPADRVELIRVSMPLREPWRSAHGTMDRRRTTLIGVERDGIVGWGECPALDGSGTHSADHDAAWAWLADRLIPTWLATGTIDRSRRQPMASAALEAAVTDLDLRTRGISLRAHLGANRTRVAAGIAVGLHETPEALRAAVDQAVAAGYQRVKVKVEQGRAGDWVAPVRRDHPDLDLWVDANGSFGRNSAADRADLIALDSLGLGLIEQPLATDDVDAHIRLARTLHTPICLDEPLVSFAATVEAVERGACSVVNLKPARVGGWHEAVRIVRWCRAQAVDLWIGGLVESGVGRAANLAFAALDGVTLIGDLSPSDRFFTEDLVTPAITMDQGHLVVPDGPGIGVDVDLDTLDRLSETRLQFN